MIGLPTIVASRIRSRAMRASRAVSPMSWSTAPRDGARQLRGAARIRHRIGDATHHILAESDLRVHRPGRGDDLARGEVAQIGGDRRRAEVDRRRHTRARRIRGRARQSRRPCAPRRSTFHLPARSVLCKSPRTARLALCRRDPIARSRANCRRRNRWTDLSGRVRDLDVMHPHDRIDVDRTHSARFLDHLAMQLAFRGTSTMRSPEIAPGSRAAGRAAAARACRRSAVRPRSTA